MRKVKLTGAVLPISLSLVPSGLGSSRVVAGGADERPLPPPLPSLRCTVIGASSLVKREVFACVFLFTTFWWVEREGEVGG